jgi:hypothetical protein
MASLWAVAVLWLTKHVQWKRVVLPALVDLAAVVAAATVAAAMAAAVVVVVKAAAATAVVDVKAATATTKIASCNQKAS